MTTTKDTKLTKAVVAGTVYPPRRGDPGRPFDSRVPVPTRVTYERLSNGRTERVVFGLHATNCHARRAAMGKAGYLRVVSIEQVTREQYEKEFPSATRGRLNRFVSLRNHA